MRKLRVITFVLTVLTLTAMTSTAFAQKIRSYGAEAETTYGTSADTSAVQAAQGQTGATQVSTVNTQAAPTGEAGQQGQEGATELEPSYVTVFNPGGRQGPLPVDLTPEKMYSGIIPGTRDEVSQFETARKKGADSSNRNRILWVGFHVKDDTTRVFFQTARPAEYDVGEEGGAVTVTFSDSQVSAYNFRRFIDTSFFDRNVTRIEMNRVNRNTVVAKIFLRSFERPDVDRSGNYVYLDFSGAKMGGSTESASDTTE